MSVLKMIGGVIVLVALYIGIASPSVYSISFPAGMGLIIGAFLVKKEVTNK